MRYEILHLKDFFPALGENGRDATLAAYLPDNLTEMGRDNEAHPSLLICPGGAYCFCSQREAEPIALHFLTVFIVNFHTVRRKHYHFVIFNQIDFLHVFQQGRNI